MKRGLSGHYETSRSTGEEVRAFIPDPPPPRPPLHFESAMQRKLEQCHIALGRLDSISTLLPNTGLFLYAYVRKEAVLSSQIEGTQSSLSDLLLFEMEEAPGVPIDDVVEVSNYVAALQHGLARLKEGSPLSNRLLREIHGVLLSSGRGSKQEPGEFRRSQNWIGGSGPGNAVFVPPPHTHVPEAMSDLERFLHADDDGLPAVARAAVAHVQFETIHPFLDGNGRVGRLLITLVLCHAGVLHEPLLYLSLYLKRNRSEYYRLLQSVRLEGDWEAWLEFFVDGVTDTARAAVTTAQRLVDLLTRDRNRIQEKGGRSAGSVRLVHDTLMERPIINLREASRRSGLSFPAASGGMALLIDLGIVRELTGKRRNRLFAYDEYLKILNEGTEV